MGAGRRDALMWAAAAGACGAATLAGVASGVGLGEALTLGVFAAVGVVTGTMAWWARPGAPIPPRRARRSHAGPHREGNGRAPT